MPSIKALINKLERLNEAHARLQEECCLCNEKVKRLRLALAEEAGTADKFQLEQQLQSESAQLKNLEQNIQNTGTEIELANRELVQAQSQLDESPTSPTKSSQSFSAESITQPIELEQLSGQVPDGSPFYLERPPIETDCYAAIVKPGALIRVKAARQMGKTSLMTRILHHAKQQGYRAVPIYFQQADADVFTTLDQFLQWFCATITKELNLADRIASLWQRETLGSKRVQIIFSSISCRN